MDNYDQAEKDITSSLDFIKNDNEPLIILSAIYIKKKNFDSALKILNKAESISNNDPIVLFQTGSIYYFKNNPVFVTYFDRLYDIAKTDEYIRQYLKAYKLLLESHFKNKNYDRSSVISDSINKVVNDSEVIIISAKSCYNLKQYEKSIVLFERVQLNSHSRLMLASAYAKTEKKNKAVIILKDIMNDESIKQEIIKDSLLKSYFDEIKRAEAEGQKQIQIKANTK